MAVYRVARGSALTAGVVANAGPGDTVMVYRSATTCPGWAVLAQATMTAFARGADVFMEPSTESTPAGYSPESPAESAQVRGGFRG